jgi:2-dehydropantoate 2-reductase
MLGKDLSILVIGAGAIGGITAAFLKKKGYNVEIICKYEDYATLIREQGIEISGISGNFIVTVPAYASVKELKGKKDLVLHATKVTDMHEAARSVLPVLSENGYLVSMQNGICEDELAGIVGPERIIGCVTGWGATMESRGRLVMTSTGDFILGYPAREADDDLLTVADVLSAVVPVRISNNIMGHLYSKLIINSNITSLGVISGLGLGKMLSTKKIRKIFIEIIREAVALADKMNIRIEVFGGRLDFRKFISGDSLLSDFRRHLMIRIIGFKYRRLKSSSLQSFERGKPTEIDFLNGYIVRNAGKLGVDVPVNSAIVSVIHEIEQGKRKISPDNFESPVFDRFNNRLL